MTLKEKIKSYSFWVSLASAIVLILKVIGTKFGFTIDASLASDLITSICSVLVITGIIVTPTSKANADLEALHSKTTIKENIAILSDNLKETADEILSKNTTPEENELITKTETLPTTEEMIEEITAEPIQEKQEEVFIEEETEQSQPQTVESVQEPIETEQPQENEPIQKPQLQQPIICENDLKMVLASEKEKWLKNIDVYYQVLLEEVKSLKPNE